MFRVALLLSCLALCHSHAVLPLVVPAVHTFHTPGLGHYAHHGFGHGLYGHGLLSHGFGHGVVAGPLGHHILKRSPHLVTPLGHIGHVAPIAHVAPFAVSHQSRLDVKTSPAVVATAVLPVVKPVVAPVLHTAPLLHKPLWGPLATHGHYGSLYPHLGHF